MKAILTKEVQSCNPLFSHAARRSARDRGEQYETSEFLTLPIGEELEGPDAWRLVAKGIAVPGDRECAQQFLNYVGSPGRQSIAEDIKLLRAAANNKQLSAKDLKRLEALERAYAVELGLVETHKDVVSKAESLVKESTDDTGGMDRQVTAEDQ